MHALIITLIAEKLVFFPSEINFFYYIFFLQGKKHFSADKAGFMYSFFVFEVT